MLFSINPLIAHAELHIPLPFSRKLWDTKTATQWKSVYLQSTSIPSKPPPSLTQTLQDVSILSRFRDQIDFALAGFLSVHGMFSIVMDCNRARHGPSLHLRTLVFQTWQHELQQILEQFEIAAVEPLKSSIPGIALIYQAVSLTLYIPLGDLEVFAGKEGLKRSSDVYEGTIKHISPTNLRQAIWHAGQVYRIAKSMPQESLTSFCATCLYFAALALWMYSTVSTGDGNRGDVEKQDIFALDAEIDSAALRPFTISGYGTPVLSSVEQPVYLDNKAAVMRLFQQVLWSKHPGGTVHSQTRALYNAFSALGSLTGMKGLGDSSSTGVRDV